MRTIDQQDITNNQEIEPKAKLFKIFPRRLILEELVSTGVFAGLYALMRFLFKDIRIINGYDIQMQFVILAIGLFSLRTFYFRLVYLVAAPFITLAFGAEFWFFNQLLPSLSFFPFIFLDPIVNKCWFEKTKSKKNTTVVILIVVLMNLMSYILVHFWYTLSGVIDYNVDWWQSFVFNAPIAYTSCAISVAVMIMSIYPIWILKGKFNPNLYYSAEC